MSKLILSIGLYLFITSTVTAEPVAVVNNSLTKYSILSSGHVTIERDYELTITSKEGDKYATYYDYYDKFKKINHLEMLIIDIYGEKVKKLTKADALDVKFSNSYEIDDSRVIILEPNYKQYPYKVKISTRITLNGFISLPKWMPQFGYNVEVEKSSFIVEYPSDYKLNLLEENIKYVTKDVLKKTDIIAWEVKKLPAISKSTNWLTFEKYQPKVILTPLDFELEGVQGSFASWENFGDWFLKLNEGRDLLSQTTLDHLDSLKSSNPDNLIPDIYHYMQDRTRYISIQLGIGGFQTIPADVVESTGYGDCKALTNYMKAMLDYVNIPSNYILVKAGADATEIRDHFPSSQFNHVFLGIPAKEDTILLECTSQMMPVDYIGEFTDDRNVLWIDRNKSKIVKSRKYDELDNVVETTGEIQIDITGDAKISANISNRGVFYDELMLYKHVSNEHAKRHNYNKFSFKDFTIKELSFSEKDRDSSVFNLQLNLAVNNIAKTLSEKMLVPLNLWIPANTYLDINNISSSVNIQRGLKVIDSFKIDVPENYWQDKLPDPISLDTEFGSYKMSIGHQNDQYVIQRELTFKKGFYENEKFNEFKKFLNKVKRADKSKIVFNSNT